MDENLRKKLVPKIVEMQKLGEVVRNLANTPCIEAYMRFVDLYCISALWQLGELDYWEYEQKWNE
jgi:hypothetical protein